MHPFDYVKPGSVEEACDLLMQAGIEARLLAGGVSVIPSIAAGRLRPAVVVDVKGLPGLDVLAYEPGLGLSIGAGVTLNRLASHPDVRRHFSLVANAAAVIGSYQIRNRATVGGNICNHTEAFDLAPALLCYDALCHLWGPGGERTTPLDSLYGEGGGLALKPGELLVRITATTSGDETAGVYHKLTQAGPRTVAGVAVRAQRAGATGICWRIALTGVTPHPVRAHAAEATLVDVLPDAKTLAKAIDLAVSIAQPEDDLYASAAYRRAMIPVLMRRGVETVVAQLWRGTK